VNKDTYEENSLLVFRHISGNYLTWNEQQNELNSDYTFQTKYDSF